MDSFKHDLTRLYPELRYFALFLTRNPDQAEDLVQETILRALASRDSFKEGTNMLAWMAAIMRNLFRSQLRRRRFTNLFTSADAEDFVEPGIPASQEAHVDFLKVLEFMEELPAAMREALRLIALEGYRFTEAAELAGVPTGTIKSRVFRGQQHLRIRAGQEPPAVPKEREPMTLSRVPSSIRRLRKYFRRKHKMSADG